MRILFFIFLILPFTSFAKAPAAYESLTACKKQDVLWEKIIKSQHKRLPPFANLGVIEVTKMSYQAMSKKADYKSDFTPKRWQKYLHKRAVVAKVKFEAVGNHNYTGIFKSGAPCAILRLSITSKPDDGIAPGLALKILRDKIHSANVSALYTLKGQENDYNFFANPLSNIVPRSKGIFPLGLRMVHGIFKQVTNYPEELRLEDFADFDDKGGSMTSALAPKQIFFVPNPKTNFSTKEHDIREDFLKLPVDQLLYEVHAVNDLKLKSFDYFNKYEHEHITQFLKNAIHIGNIYNTSEFIASEFGDTGMFFRHQVEPK